MGGAQPDVPVILKRAAATAAAAAAAGPDMGVPSLTFQSFYEAKYGAAGWAALDKIPKEEWMAYLMWYR
jgi:hypothetical protein